MDPIAVYHHLGLFWPEIATSIKAKLCLELFEFLLGKINFVECNISSDSYVSAYHVGVEGRYDVLAREKLTKILLHNKIYVCPVDVNEVNAPALAIPLGTLLLADNLEQIKSMFSWAKYS